MSGFSTPQPTTGDLNFYQYQLNGYLLTIQNAQVQPARDWTISLWDDAGNAIYTDLPLNGANSGLSGLENLWHARDDGNGAFTLFFLGDPFGGRTGIMQSYDAKGAILSTDAYDQPTRQIDVFGTKIDQKYIESFTNAVDLDNGKIAAVTQDSLDRDFHLAIYNADGTLDTITAWTPTLTGNGAVNHALGLELVRSGDKLFVFHMDDNLDTGDFTVYGQVFDLNAKSLINEFQVSEGQHAQATFGFSSGQVTAETLTDGKVVVAWTTEKVGVSDAGYLDIWYKIYNADGSVFKSEAMVNPNLTGEHQSQPRIHALSDGGFVITYNTDDYSILDNTGVIQCFDASGALVGAAETPFARFESVETSVIFENGFGYFDGLGSPLYTASLSGLPPVTPPVTGSVIDGTKGKDKLVGTTGDDVMNGLAKNDRLKGLAGDDTLNGGGGSDFLNGGKGADALNGGKGKDWADYSTASKGVKADLAKSGKNKGEAKGDTYSGVENLKGSKKSDKLFGDKKANKIDGGSGNDTLFGHKGKDVLNGGDGKDIVDGGKGDDTLTGGKKTDVFVFNDGHDTIRDWKKGESIELDDALWKGATLTTAEVMDFADVVNGDTVFTFSAGDSLTLLNATSQTDIEAALIFV